MRSKGDRDLEHRDVEQNGRFGGGIGRLAQVIDVAIGSQAADDQRTRWSIQADALGADRDLAIIADPDAGALTPDERPPGARGDRADDGAFLGERLLSGQVGSGPQLPMHFGLIDVRQELVEQVVGPFQFQDTVSGQQGWQAFLPEVVPPLNFSFGLRCGCVTQGDPVETKGLAELGKSFGNVGEKEGMVVHIKSQGQTMGLKRPGQEVQMSQQRFAGIEPSARIITGRVIQQVEQALFLRTVRQPGMRAGIVLPERTVIAGLPAPDGFGWSFVSSVWSEAVFDSPSADTGTVGLEV